MHTLLPEFIKKKKKKPTLQRSGLLGLDDHQSGLFNVDISCHSHVEAPKFPRFNMVLIVDTKSGSPITWLDNTLLIELEPNKLLGLI